MMIVPLPWDSSFFGLRVAKAVVFEQEDVMDLLALEDSLRKEFDLLYIFAPPELNWPSGKMFLVDKKAEYSVSVSPQPNSESLCVRKWEQNEVTEELRQLALTSGKYSRFKIDNRFPKGSYERLYSQWIEQSVSHSIASDVFCCFEGTSPIGIVTLRFEKENSRIGLVAVDEQYQKQGIGLTMMHHVIDYTYRNQGSQLSVATQKHNEAACHLYEKSGFSLISVTDVWHWWL